MAENRNKTENRNTSENGRTARNWCIILLIAVIAAVLMPVVSADCPSCGGGSAQQQAAWDNEATNFLAGKAVESNSSTPTVYNAKVARENNPSLKSFGFSSDNGSENSNSAKTDPQPAPETQTPQTQILQTQTPQIQTSQTQIPQRSGSFAKALAPLSEVKNADVVLDISPNSTEYIAGAININYENFFGDDKREKSVSEIAEILGDAGITQNDSVLIYGECQPCGGGPSAATYAYWLMKYLGHDKVKLLDGGIDDWVAAKLQTQDKPAVLPQKVYIPTIKPELLANYDYVKSGIAQIVDARTVEEFEAGSITGSVNIPYDKVLDGKRLKEEAAVENIFSGLSKDKPVVVYTNTGVKGSMIWLALNLLGYDARLYSWQDWMDHQSLNLSLESVKADPNPAKTGDIVKITAVFRQSNDSMVSASSQPTTPSSSTNGNGNETILKIKGCSTCGAEGFFLDTGGMHTGNGSGVVQLGSAGTGSSQMQMASGQSDIKCTATIINSDGTEVDKRNMQQVSDREFSGIWNANVAGGSYNVTITASSPGITKIFRDKLEIVVADSTSRYMNVGK